MNEINSFTFYRDYFNLIDTMSIDDKKELAIAILDYVFKDEIPKLEGHNKAIFTTLSHQLNVSKNKSKSAKKDTSKLNQKEIKLKSNENQMKIKKDNKTSILSFKFYISNFNNINNNNLLISKIEEWIKYKKENKFEYTEIGLKTLLKQIDTNCEKHGFEEIINLIDESMANGYKGIIFKNLKDKPKKVNNPKWFNKQQEDVKATAEEIEEMNSLLSEFK